MFYKEEDLKRIEDTIEELLVLGFDPEQAGELSVRDDCNELLASIRRSRKTLAKRELLLNSLSTVVTAAVVGAASLIGVWVFAPSSVEERIEENYLTVVEDVTRFADVDSGSRRYRLSNGEYIFQDILLLPYEEGAVVPPNHPEIE